MGTQAVRSKCIDVNIDTGTLHLHVRVGRFEISSIASDKAQLEQKSCMNDKARETFIYHTLVLVDEASQDLPHQIPFFVWVRSHRRV